MGFTAVAAVIEGTATATTVAAAVGEVGLAMSVVGAVTGNSTLMKVGGTLGLAGGIGSFAMGFGDAAASEAVNMGAPLADGLEGDMAGSGAAGGAVTSPIDLGTGAPGGFDPNAGINPPGITRGVADDVMDMDSNQGYAHLGGSNPFNVDPLGTGPIAPAGQTVAPDAGSGIIQGSAQPSIPPTQAAPPTPDASSVSAGTAPTPDDPTGAIASGDPMATGVSSPQSTKTFFDKMTGFIQDPKNSNFLKLGAGALQGMGTAYDANRKYELGKGQLAINQQAANLAAQQAKNANSLPTISNGIISSARG